MYHGPIQLDVFWTVVQLRRFYQLSMQRDLFGRVSLVRELGRIGYRGQMLVEA
jgi:predicted DNA-binding WGR domain protein